MKRDSRYELIKFQFTHPGKGATRIWLVYLGLSLTVSIHAPWEGCDRTIIVASSESEVSIHAPWEGCDGEPRA